MPLAIQIDVRTGEGFDLRGLEAALAPERISTVGGRAAVGVSRKHLLGLNRSRPNRLGGRRSNFYQHAGNSINTTTAGDTFTISFGSVGLAQRYFGGTIRAKNAKYLTIPARAEAYGKRASEFNDLQFVVFESGPALVRRSQSTIKFRKGKDGSRRAVRSGDAAGEVMFWLRRSVDQAPDPSVLPTEQEYGDAVEKAVTDTVHREIDRATGGAAP